MPVKSKKIKKIYNDNFTGEKFTYHIEPEKSNDPAYIINTPNFKMYMQHGKAYINDGAEITGIDIGSYNKAIQAIAGMSDESAADKVKTMYRSGSLKKLPKVYGISNRNKMYQRI